MRKRQIPIALLIASASPFASNVIADSAWQGSYSANGQCFCSGKVSLSIASRIVPTPIGGQTVKQVCAALGEGPELIKSNGLFNHPVFEDAQCGNGPFASASVPTDAACVGTLDGADVSCQPAGPGWDLAQAFAVTPAASALASVEVDVKDPPGGVASANVADKVETQTSIKLASSSASLATGTSSLSGKSVMLGGVRYFQARKGTPSTGGAPGSRIILDGLVYLKADENLAQADLYQTAEDAPKIAAAVPENVEIDTNVTQKQAVKQQDAVRRARLALETKQRKEKALAAYQEEKNAREARLIEQRMQAEQEKITSQEKSAKQVRLAGDNKKQTTASDKEALAEASRQVESKPGDETLAALLTALRMPEDTRASSRDFGYIEAMPLMSYDIGGNGLMLEGSGQLETRFQFLGRLGISDTYNEVMVGGGYYLTPKKATRMTVVMLAGIEHGSFELRDEERAPGVSLTSSDTGLFLGALSRLVINNKFEIKGGVGFSSFFGGDATLFGGGYYHLTPQLDVMSRFKLGDNDSFGLGIRYYY